MSCIDFNSCYLQQCLSIDLFPYGIPGHGQKGHTNKVCQFFSLEVFLELALWFFLEFNMVLGTHVVLRMAELDLLKMFCPQNGDNRPSLGFFECMRKFSFFSQFFNFFLNLVYNESLYYCNCCMLEQIRHRGLLQSDTSILDEFNQACPKYPK